MSCDRKCIYCVNFIYKIMLFGSHGICDKNGKPVSLGDNCDDFYPGRNKIYRTKDGEQDDEQRSDISN